MTKVENLIDTLRHAPPQVVTAWDLMNAPMVGQWCEVIGIDNMLYLDEEAARSPRRFGRSSCHADFLDHA